MPTRRQFLLSCSALAVTASIAPVSAMSGPFQFGAIELDRISFNDFASAVNTSFHVIGKSRAEALHLFAAEQSLPPSFPLNAEDAANEKFSLLFYGANDGGLTQDTYDFEHSRIGRFQMFITPVGAPKPGRRLYEAVFNRPVPGGKSPVTVAARNSRLDSPHKNHTGKIITSQNS